VKGKSDFERAARQVDLINMKQFLIIGNSAAGIAAAEAIRNKDKESRIVIISDEEKMGRFYFLAKRGQDYL